MNAIFFNIVYVHDFISMFFYFVTAASLDKHECGHEVITIKCSEQLQALQSDPSLQTNSGAFLIN